MSSYHGLSDAIKNCIDYVCDIEDELVAYYQGKPIFVLYLPVQNTDYHFYRVITPLENKLLKSVRVPIDLRYSLDEVIDMIEADEYVD